MNLLPQIIQNRIQEILVSNNELSRSPLPAHQLTQLWLLHNHIENLDQINQESLLALTRDFQEIKTQIENATQSDEKYHDYYGTAHDLTLTLLLRNENRSQRIINKESLRILYIECQIRKILESDSVLSESGLSPSDLTRAFLSDKLNRNVEYIDNKTLSFVIEEFKSIKANIESIIESDQPYYSDLESVHELTLLWFKYKHTGYLEPINKETLRILHIESQIRKILESDRDLKQLLPSPYELTQLWFSHKNVRSPDKINKSILLIFLISLLDNDNEANQNLHALLPGFNQLNQYPHFINSHKISKKAAGISLRRELTSIYLNSIIPLPQITLHFASVNLFSFGATSLFNIFILQLEELHRIDPSNPHNIIQLLRISMLNACAAGQIQLINKLFQYIQNLRQLTDAPSPFQVTQQNIFRIFISVLSSSWTALDKALLCPSIHDENRDMGMINVIYIAKQFGGIKTFCAVIEGINRLADDETAKHIIQSGLIGSLYRLVQNRQKMELKFCIDYIIQHYPDDIPIVLNQVLGKNLVVDLAFLQTFINLRSVDTYKEILWTIILKIPPCSQQQKEVVISNLITIFMHLLDEKTIILNLFSAIPDDYKEFVLNAFEEAIHEVDESDEIIDELRKEYDIQITKRQRCV